MAATTEQTKQAKKAEAKKIPALRVTTKREGFRRAGIEWNGTATVPLDQLSEDDIKALEEEPMLIVEQTEMDAQPENVAE